MIPYRPAPLVDADVWTRYRGFFDLAVALYAVGIAVALGTVRPQ